MTHSIQLKVLSSLEKIFPDSNLAGCSFSGFSMLRNERASFQTACLTDDTKDICAELEIISDLARYIRAFEVCMIPAGAVPLKNTDDYYITKDSADFPELLIPVESRQIRLKAGKACSFWFEIKAEHALPAGNFDITICVKKENQILASTSLQVTVIDALLPKQTLLFTNWFHTDCLASHYKVRVFSQEYWKITENYLKRAHEFGVNMILTPVFTPPLDTEVGGERPTVQLVDVTVSADGSYRFGFSNFDRWISMCNRCGIEYYEISHFFTQWGAKHAPKIIADTPVGRKQIFGWDTDASGDAYRCFMRQFASAFIRHLEEKGMRDKCVLHVSDEPTKEQLDSYKKASTIMHDCFPGFRIIDALSDYSYYEQKLVDIPIPANDHIEPFIGNVPELWTYYCGAQGSDYVSNRFFSVPSQRNRILGYQLYKFQAVGFLHWAFNFWFTRLSARQVDPFTETDAGGRFCSGDSFVVYPAADGTPLDSLRLHVFYDGLQDMMALQLLESRIGRDAVINLLESETKQPITFSRYPHSSRWHLETREKINQAIRENA